MRTAGELNDCWCLISEGFSMSTSSHPLATSIPAAAKPVLPQDPAVPVEVYAEVARLGIGEQFPEVIALTREIFGDFTIDISEDPEIYNCIYVSFDVIVHGAIEDCVERTSEWHCRLPHWPSQVPGSFCLVTRFAK
jgi:hypothetical protein